MRNYELKDYYVFCNGCCSRIGEKLHGFKKAKEAMNEHVKFHKLKKTNYLAISISDWRPPEKIPKGMKP